MKDKKMLVIRIVELIIGFILFNSAQNEISNSFGYTWRSSYTEYDSQVIATKWLGIILMVAAVINIGLKVYQEKYGKDPIHMSDNIGLTNSVKCTQCGLILTKDTKICPRCENNIVEAKSGLRDEKRHPREEKEKCFCTQCGTKLSAHQKYCPKCGEKVD
jgi:hypothetical protein